MANTNKHEHKIKSESLIEAFEYLVAKTLASPKAKRKNLATAKAVVELANSNERVLNECEHGIGEKIFNQVKKGNPICDLKDKVEDFKKEFSTIKQIAQDKTREAIERLDRKLFSNEVANVELMDKLHALKEDYQRLQQELERVRMDRDNFATKVEKLRKENIELRKTNAL